MSSLWGALGGLGDWAQGYGDQISKSALAEKLEKAREDRAEAREAKRYNRTEIRANGDGSYTAVDYNSFNGVLGERPANAKDIAAINASNASTKASEGTERRAQDRHPAQMTGDTLSNEGKKLDNDYNTKYRPKLAESTLASQAESRRASRESSARAERASKDKASASEDTSTEEDTIAKLAKWAKDNPALTVPGILTEDGKALTPEGQRAARDAVDMARQMKITLQEAFMQLMSGDVMRVRHSDVVLPSGKK